MQTSAETLAKEGSRIIIIGPLLPYRGGIAQHTTLLARALSLFNSCRVFSFKRLYPQWLYPGQSDRDPNYEGHQELRAAYFLDSLNPLTWRRVAKEAMAAQPDFVLIPWWISFLGPLFAYLSWSLRRNGIEVVFFCHNVLDHEEAAWERQLTRLVLRHGSRFVVHSRVEEARLRRLLPSARVAVHPHPIYDQFPEPKRQLPRRAGLELLFYGFVRPYKGLNTLVDAMGLLRGEDVFLTVAGEFWGGEGHFRDRIGALGLENQIEIRQRYQSNEETAELFQRADVLVLPYRSATASGVVPIAYHYNRPVIVTAVGGLPDVVIEGETGHIVAADDANVLAAAIRSLNQVECKAMQPNIERFKQRLSWASLANTVCGQTGYSEERLEGRKTA